MTPSEDPDLEVRPAAPPDAAAAGEVYRLSRGSAPGMPPSARPDAEIRRWLDRVFSQTQARREAWVAESGGVVVGFLLLEEDWLHSLYVHPEHQRNGVGSVLLGLAQTQRPEGFSLWVFEANRAARAFYGHHGLTELERTDGSGTDEGVPDVRMAWPGGDPLRFLRRQIDEVDDELGRCLARRAALTRAVQDHKTVPGQAGREPDRERDIAARMAAHAPALGANRLYRIVSVVITESLAAAESGPDPARRGR